MPPLKIAHCTFSRGQGNGIAAIDRLLKTYLDPDIVDVDWFYIETTPDRGEAYVNDGVLIVPLGNSFDILSKKFLGVDVVHFNGSYDPVVCYAARSAGVKIVIESMHQIEQGFMHPEIVLSVCVSNAVKSIQPMQERCVVIHNGIDTTYFRPLPSRKMRSAPTFVQPCRADKPMHRQLYSLKSLIHEFSPDAILQHAGGGWLRTNFPNVSNDVQFLGLVSDMPSLFQTADYMVLLSKEEPFGLVAAEAMACGCLPIVSNDGGLAEIVDHGKTGWIVDATDDQALRKTLREALEIREDSSAWRTMQKEARKKVVKHFSAQTMCRRYESLYRAVSRGDASLTETDAFNRDPANNIEVQFLSACMLCAQQRYINEALELFLKISSMSETINTKGKWHPNWHSSFQVCISAGYKLYEDEKRIEGNALFQYLYSCGIRNSDWESRWKTLEGKS